MALSSDQRNKLGSTAAIQSQIDLDQYIDKINAIWSKWEQDKPIKGEKPAMVIALESFRQLANEYKIPENVRMSLGGKNQVIDAVRDLVLISGHYIKRNALSDQCYGKPLEIGMEFNLKVGGGKQKVKIKTIHGDGKVVVEGFKIKARMISPNSLLPILTT